MTLLAVVRCGGVGLALAGAVVTAPAGTVQLLRDIQNLAVGVWRLIAWYVLRRQRTGVVGPAHSVSLSISSAGGMSVHGYEWSESATVEEKIRFLRERLDEQARRMNIIEDELAGLRGFLEEKIERAAADLQAKLEH